MKLDTVGYRYTTDELSVLMSLQGYEHIRAVPDITIPDREHFSRGIGLLEEKDILSNVSGHILLDRIHAFLISNLCECDNFFQIRQRPAWMAVCACPQTALMVTTRDSEHWVIYAAPDLEGFQEEYQSELMSFRNGTVICVTTCGEETEIPVTDEKMLITETQKVFGILKKSRNLFE